MNKPYVIGIDFGTLSGRCILVDGRDGRELADAVLPYAHAVLSEQLPGGRKLPPQFALQIPTDYLDVLRVTVREVLQKADINAEQIAALGVDFTGCTMLPVDRDGIPLCCLPEFYAEPHAYVKLWKHHAAGAQAERINRLASERGEPWLHACGGAVSPEWMIPKILEIAENAPNVYRAADRFTEAADWLSRVLTGTETHSGMFAGYKANWIPGQGYPSDEFLTALHPALHGIVGSKLSVNVPEVGAIAGVLNRSGAELTGLTQGTPVAMPMIDGHAAIPALGTTGDGEMTLILGTSGIEFLNSSKAMEIPGICGYVRDYVVSGCCTYEAGQAAVGDIFDWFIRNGVPQIYMEEARMRGIGIHRLLREKAAGLRPGESGLLALDWLNGNRNILNEPDLSGMILGLTLQSKPEEIYRAWIESAAYGARIIAEHYETHGLSIRRVVAAGGIAQKDEMLMQIYADVLKKEIAVTSCTQAASFGSAIAAAVAGGIYPDMPSAIRALSRPICCTYRPIPKHCKIYDLLFEEYKKLHGYFGISCNSVMKVLRNLSGKNGV